MCAAASRQKGEAAANWGCLMYRQAVILMSLFIASCTAMHDVDPEKQDKATAAAAAAGLAPIDDARCQSFGFKPGSPSYAQCRKNLDDQHAQMSHE